MSIKSKFFTKWGDRLFKNGHIDFSFQMYDKAIEADSKDIKPYIAKAGILLRLERFEGALKVLDQAVVASPENAKEIDKIRPIIIKAIFDVNRNKKARVL